MKDLKIIAGLGNPGLSYKKTRHNAGYLTVDRIALEHGILIKQKKFEARVGEGLIDKTRVMLVKPLTYMNRSGESLRQLADWFKIPASSIIVIYDDIDLPVGTIRVRAKGSAGTHNGMRSVIECLRTQDFPRVRIGIGKPPVGQDLISYVLGKFNKEEREIIEDAVILAAKAAVTAAVSGTDTAMNRFNRPVNGDDDEILHR